MLGIRNVFSFRIVVRLLRDWVIVAVFVAPLRSIIFDYDQESTKFYGVKLWVSNLIYLEGHSLRSDVEEST